MPLLADRSGPGSRTAGALVAVFAVLVLVGTVAAYVNFQHKVDDAATAAEGHQTEPAAPDSEQPSAGPTTPASHVVSLWIGDGYTAGSGADTPRTGEACVAAKELGWICRLDAEKGTGFLSNGHVYDAANATLPDRLDGPSTGPAPDVVVVDAGRNDLGVYSTPAIEEAMDDYLGRLRTAYPTATLIQVVPWTLSQDAPVPGLSGTVADLMKEYDGYVVDPYAEGWAGAGRTDLAPLVTSTGVSTQPGHDLIGDQLAASIRALDLPVSTAKG
jgi:hypothetical protein